MRNMRGQVALITGATNGLGEVTARELAKLGATVVIVGRSKDKAVRVTQSIMRETNNADVHHILGDLSLMADVRKVAANFRDQYDRLDVLVNNAGMIFTERQVTSEGLERTFALNHISYFLLTNLLLDMLKASGSPNRKARIVNVSSGAHTFGSVDFDDLNSERSYNGMRVYGTTKLQNILFTYELARRLEAEGANVTANVLHPGAVATGFGKNNDGLMGTLAKGMMTLMKPFLLNAEKGAETQIYLAASQQVEGVNGKYFEKKRPKPSSDASYDEEAARRLWEASESITELRQPAMV